MARQTKSDDVAPPYADPVTFKDRLKAARNERGLSGAALGELIGGIARQTINHWEKDRHEPNLTQIQKLCEVLNKNADWLVNGRGKDDLSPAAVAIAKRFDKLTPAEQDKWRALVDVATGPALELDEKRAKHQKKIEEHYKATIDQDPAGITGNTPQDAIAIPVSSDRGGYRMTADQKRRAAARQAAKEAATAKRKG